MNRNSFMYYFLRPLKRHYDLSKFQALWRSKNMHNSTEVKNKFQIDRVEIGKYTYGDLEVYTFGEDDSYLKIGCFCSIAGNVKFLLGGEHPLKYISTYPFSVHVYNQKEGKSSKGNIVVDDDVWICDGCTILSGVHIGRGAVVGAGSIVTKDIPPYGIYVNNEVKRYRFNENIRNKLMQIDFNKIDLNCFRELSEIELSDDNIDEIVKKIKLMNPEDK